MTADSDPDAHANSTDRPSTSRRRFLRATAGAVGAVAGAGLAPAATAQSDVPVLDLTGEAPATEGELPAEHEELVLFVHGWLGTSAAASQTATLRESLREAGYEHPVLAVRWDATNPVFSAAQSDADVAGERLAAWVESYRSEQPDVALRTVAHSLGGRVVLSALAATGASPLFESVAPVGAAVVSDAVCPDGRYHGPIADAAGEVHNYHSENDATVCTSFGVAGGGLGCTGAACDGPPANYADVDVTDRVESHGAYVEPDGGCVDAVVERWRDGDADDPCRDDAVTGIDGVDPRDDEGDGVYRDVDGDGSVGQADVATFFRYQHRSAFKERPSCFDYSGNGAVTHGDVVELFDYVALN